MKIIGNRIISIAECLFIINKRELSAIVMHTRQHEIGQENAVTIIIIVFNAIERYEKRYGFVHVLSINRHHYGCVKLTMSIDAPGTIQNFPLETVIKHPACTTTKKTI